MRFERFERILMDFVRNRISHGRSVKGALAARLDETYILIFSNAIGFSHLPSK